MRLRLVTLNAGLLNTLRGRIAPAPYVEERLAILPEALRGLHAQLVVLQEVYRERHRQYLLSELQEVFPYSAYVRGQPLLGLGNSLVVCSAVPLECRFERFRAATLDEKLFGRYGFLVCRFEDGNGTTWSLLNVHTTAGGLWQHPESPRVDLVRARQIEQLLNAARSEPGISIIAGDLNTGPGVSEKNFCQLEEAGYKSIHDLLNGPESGSTWDPQNPLNREGPHRACPPQRIDHIFVRKQDLAARLIVPFSSAICLRDPVVRIGTNCVTVSDHYGLCVDLELNPRQQAGALEVSDPLYSASPPSKP